MAKDKGFDFSALTGGFKDLGGAVSDIFGAIGAKEGADLKAEGMRIKARGDLAEADNYDLAAGLARQNRSFTEESFGIQQTQLDRSINKTMSGQRADIAGAGFAESGSSLDVLADSARQGALAHQVLGQQGMIQEAGYEEQAKSYETMAKAGRDTAAAEMGLADKTAALGATAEMGGIFGGAIKGITGLFEAAGPIAGLLAL